MLQDGATTLHLWVRGRTVYFQNNLGDSDDLKNSRQLDWLQECMESVRSEFGQ